jgi:hypothetical protein
VPDRKHFLILRQAPRAGLLVVALLIAAVVAIRLEVWIAAYSPLSVLKLAALPSTLALLFTYVAAFREAAIAKRVLSEAAMLAAAVLAAEALLLYGATDPADRPAVRAQAASKLGVAFDTRQVSRFIDDLQQTGPPVYPAITRTWPRFREVRRVLPQGFYPLSHVSNSRVVKCNENGQYLLYRTDEYGFDNPPGLLQQGSADVAVVGESFALGHCMPEQDNLVGMIRAHYPRTVNLSMASSQPLTTLASFREYVEPLRPRVVLWTVNIAFVDGRAELRDPVLVRYLDPAFNQGLIRRQAEVDRLVSSFALPLQRRFDERERLHRAGRWKHVWELRAIRSRLPQLLNLESAVRKRADASVLLRSLDLAGRTTQTWGGVLIVVIVPAYYDVFARGSERSEVREELKRSIAALGIRVVDTVELFRHQRDPTSLYMLRINNHPNQRGYTLFADQVLAAMPEHLPQQVATASSGSAP